MTARTWLALPVCMAILLSATPAAFAAASVRADFDPNADFTKFKTFAWLQDPRSAERTLESTNQLAHKRIVAAVESELKVKGYAMAGPDKADMLITYYVGLKEKVDVSSYGYRYGWYGPSSVDVWQYTEGTLTVDFIDGASKDMVWRGAAVQVVGDPKNQEKRINAAVKKLFKKFPPPPKKKK